MQTQTSNKTLQEIISLFSSDPVQHFVKTITKIDPGDDYPYQEYIGFNLTRERILNCKFYVGYFKKLTEGEVSQFLPVTQDFWHFYEQWTPSKLRSSELPGCTFAAKVSPDKKPVSYFHYKIPLTKEVLNASEVPADSQLNFRDCSSSYGWSFEYRGNETLNKRYFYFDRLPEKQIIAERFSEPICLDAELLEYTKTEIYEKVILWLPGIERCKSYCESLNWSLLNDLISWMYSQGCIPMFPGLYAGGNIRSVLFFKFPRISNFPFNDPRNLQINTIREFPCFTT